MMGTPLKIITVSWKLHNIPPELEALAVDEAVWRGSPEPLGDPPKAFRIKKVSMLGNVSESLIKSFALNISTPQLNENFRKKLIEVISKNSKGGKIPLSMFVYDPVTKYNLEFLSKKFQINISSEFINELERLGVRYSIIKRN